MQDVIDGSLCYPKSMSKIYLEDAAEAFLKWRRAQGYAATTVKNDKAALKMMMDVLGDPSLQDIDHNSVIRVISHAAETRCAAATNTTQATYTVFFKWARLMKYVTPDHDPMLGVRNRKVPKKDRLRIPAHEFGRLLDCAANPRDRILLAVGLYLFLRQSEVKTLKVKDLDLNEGTLNVVVHKTKDHDRMTVPAELDAELRAWLLHYQEACGPLQPDWFLIPSRKMTGWQRMGLNPTKAVTNIEAVLKQTLDRFGIVNHKGEAYHTLRRSGARAWFDALNEQTIDNALKIVQAQLHHSSVLMTEKYLGITHDRVTRDRLLKGQAMFPALAAPNVVRISRTG